MFKTAAQGYHIWMRIVCLSCAAAYDVPESKLAPGGLVRCARCGESWAPLPPLEPAQAEPPEPEAELEPVSEPKPEPEPEPAPEPAPDPPLPAIEAPLPVVPPLASHWVTFGWAATAVVILASGYGLFTARDLVMHAWPPSERLYGALGLASAQGLENMRPSTPSSHK